MTSTPPALANNLGPSLRRWRVLNRVKQQALAAEFGVSQTRISRWENGSAFPDGPQLSRLIRLLEACPASASDAALRFLVETAEAPVHLVCDLTHRLLAASPARSAEWRHPIADYLGTPLWRFATEEIRQAENELPERGWFEPISRDIVFATGRLDHPEMSIPESQIRISRMPLSDGRFARLVRAEPVAA